MNRTVKNSVFKSAATTLRIATASVLLTMSAVSVTVLAAGSTAKAVICAIDKLTMVYTGQSEVDDGVTIYRYRCPNGHVIWSATKPSDEELKHPEVVQSIKDQG